MATTAITSAFFISAISPFPVPWDKACYVRPSDTEKPVSVAVGADDFAAVA